MAPGYGSDPSICQNMRCPNQEGPLERPIRFGFPQMSGTLRRLVGRAH